MAGLVGAGLGRHLHSEAARQLQLQNLQQLLARTKDLRWEDSSLQSPLNMERQLDFMHDKTRWEDPLTDQAVEHWDDDDFANLDDIQFRTASTASSVASWQHNQVHHIDRKDSIRSRLSARSDRGSNQDDQDWDVVVDQSSVNDAVAIAKRTGIPIPANVPQSALVGGTIRKMPGKKIKQAMSEDWTEDLDFDGPLKLRSTSNSLQSPSKSSVNFGSDGFDDDFDLPSDAVLRPRQASTRLQAPLGRPAPNEKDNFSDDFDLPSDKQFSPRRLPIRVQAPTPRSVKMEADDFEADFELPKDGLLRRRQPSTPFGALHQPDDIDLEWAEGSLGTRNAGTRRDGRSNRSSSVSAFSPSMSSAITESEDEGLDGLILPTGPVNFEEILKKRQQNQSPDVANYSGERNAAKRAAAKDDFFAGIEVGDGDIFDTGKLTLNRNIKHKIQRQTSPARRPATTLTFTNNKPQSTISRLPRFQATKDRPRSTLEPVSETGNAVSRYKRPESRTVAHTTQSSTSSIPTPSPPSAPSTPSRRTLRTQESHEQIRYDAPTTTNAQLLRAKRSMPVMRSLNSPNKLSTYPRPPSRNNDGAPSRLHIPSRPKTPTERAESRIGDVRRPPVPFLPAGVSTTQSQHVSIKSTTTRHYRRNDSDGSNDGSLAGLRSHSRLAYRPETPGRGGGSGRGSLTPAELAAAAKKTITKPTRRRNFGDGNELDIFDDLPTSASAESKFIKQPVGRGAPRSLRSRLGQSHIGNSTTSLSTRGGAETPMPTTPLSPSKPDLNVPRFARDTAASRNAREQRQVSTTYNPREPTRGPLTPITDNWKAHIAARPNLNAPSSRKRGNKVQQKPHLIKPIGDAHMKEPKSVKGMHYNPLTFRWEGNENDLEPFEIPAFYPPSSPEASPASKPPALITNVGQAGGVQVVGEMVFDPRRMCWLKMAPTGLSHERRGPDSAGVSSVQLEDEEDVFAGLEDLKEEDETGRSSYGGGGGGLAIRGGEDLRHVSGGTTGDGSGDELGPVLGEEFDVGPEFIRRQRAEEEKWRRKVEAWLRSQESMDVHADVFSGWRWGIREIVMSTATE